MEIEFLQFFWKISISMCIIYILQISEDGKIRKSLTSFTTALDLRCVCLEDSRPTGITMREADTLGSSSSHLRGCLLAWCNPHQATMRGRAAMK